MQAVSYLGVPLTDVDGAVLGHLAVLDKRPMPANPDAEAILEIFAGRASAELQRLRAAEALRDRERELDGVLTGAMDAIVGLDASFRVTLANPAAERLFRCPAGELVGSSFGRFLDDAARARWPELVHQLGLEARSQALWVPGGLTALRSDGSPFPAEVTIATYQLSGARRYSLVVRDVNDRVRAEREIATLTSEREYLRRELSALRHFDRIIGRSPAMRAVIEDVVRVAKTDATVLILGETGTGKELVAHAIHAESARRERPLVTVNCAAVPATLIESEFFGHEKGAFTGATQRREGRFALADGGTIFLDEVGELPLELQPKLLRALQQGEFEPVGSSRTRRVDVRLVAATNRDLSAAVKEGTFREDLFYRLNVFPVRVPPLRERGDDVVLLAESFARRFADRMRTPLAPLTEEMRRQLRAYQWPGNVRELQNVIERAVILARDGQLALSRCLPDAVPTPPAEADATPPIYTAAELAALERANLLRALEASGWKIAGPNGAAARLGLKPSTLSSRLAALGIERQAAR
jgi:PAS domain S-box-containing protein